MPSLSSDITTDDAMQAIDRAEYIANADRWPSEGRAMDVQTQYLRAIALALVALANETRSVARATYSAGPV